MQPSTVSAPAIAPGDRFLRISQVLDRVGIGRTAWTDYVREGRAPASIKIGAATCWLESSVNAWMAERIAESRQRA